ncbi:MAG: response regulator [Candidatus Acidiferrales bacterium]
MPKILVADDNTNIQKMVVLAFQERGIDVVAVGNGESAVRKLNDVNPDLVLADVFMPVRNGYEVCEFIKKDTRMSHVPVILMVGAFDPLDEKEARRVGADGVLKKPFVPPDPLIAMVMSALEKNPRVAAELAKAKEVPAEPPPPPAMEIQAKKEPVPLPSFPDPTPEEAAAIYGFGKGVRGDEGEVDAKVAPLKGKASDEEGEEEFDGASTQSNWRRAGMDLEIPEDIAGQPSFSTEQDFAPVTFPSERDVPPRHVRVEEPAAQVIEFVKPQPEPEYEAIAPAKEPAAEISAPAAHAELVSAPAPAPAETFEVPQAEVHEPEPASSGAASWMSAPEATPAVHEAAPEVSSSFAQAAEENSEPAASAIAHEEVAALKVEEIAAQEEIAAPRQATHWMDLMSSDASEGHQESSWQAAFATPEEAPAQVSEPVSARASTEPEAEAAKESNESEAAQITEADPRAFGEASRPDRGGFSYHFATSEISGGKQKVPDQVRAEVREEVREEVRAVLHERESQTANIEENLPAYSNIVSGAAQASRPRALQRVFEAETESPALPSAEIQAPTPYSDSAADSGSDDVSETHPSLPEATAEEGEADSFFALEPAAPACEASPSEEPAEARTKSFFDALAARSNERIPTSAPQTREDLAGIPFLAPPQPAAHGTNGTSQTDDKTIDSVVQKVLERLEPQLHDLLAKGVLKPLIENLLQQELEKKAR